MKHINTLKVMIVDDEFPIRKWFSRAIKNLPDIKVDFAGAASNGEEALQIFREKRPDVVFTDIKMPIMDGLSLLRQIKKERPETDVIIITSYDEFAYAKEAIAQDAYDYILKTEANPRMLSDLLQKIQGDRKSTIHKDQLALRFEQEIYLNGLLKEENPDCSGEQMASHGIYLNEHGMFAAAFCTNSFVPEKMMEIFVNSGIENVLYYPYRKNVLIAIGNTACIDQLAYQNQVIYQFADKISICFDSAVGVSGPYYKYGHLVTMIMKSIMALEQSFYRQNAKRIYFARDICGFEGVREQLDLWEQRIAGEMKNGNMEQVPVIFEEIFSFLEEREPGDVNAVKRFIFRILANIYQVYTSDRFGFAEKMGEIYRGIEQCTDFDRMKECVYAALEEAEDSRSGNQAHYTSYVAKAVRYIEKNYRQIGSVSEVAGEVGLNQDYLFHLFKNETGVTFSEFLNSTRMNRAIWLLNNTQLKSYEIAEQVGYSNQAYFSRLFKQKFQMTPYEFRNMRGKQ